jgi:hypothetical protein
MAVLGEEGVRNAQDSVLSALPLNEDGKIEGFQFGGRDRAIAEWRERKEEKEFNKLCRRLKLNKQARDRFRDNPIWREHRRKYMASYMRERWHSEVAFREKHKALARAWKQKRQPVRTCLECGVQWVNQVGHNNGHKPRIKFCSAKHRRRFYNRNLAEHRKASGYKWPPRPNRNRARNERNRLLRLELERRGIKIMRQIMCECGHGNWAHERAKGSEGRPGKPGRCTGGTGPCPCAKFKRAKPNGYHDRNRR